MDPRFDDVEWAVARFESTEREAWQKPDAVVAALGLKGGERVVDLGASTGWFARRVARAVGPQGHVLALDVEAPVLDWLKTRAAQEGLNNLETRVVAPDDPGLEPRSQDLVLIFNVLHHVDNPLRWLRRVRRSLRFGGRLAIIEFKPRPGPAGPPLAWRIAASRMRRLVRQAGFRVWPAPRFLPYQYFLLAVRS